MVKTGFIFLFLMLCGLNLWAVPGTEEGIQSLPEELREEARAYLKKYQALQKLKREERVVHMDVVLPKSVFSKPGIFTTKDCQIDAAENPKSQPCKAVGWPDSESDMLSTGNFDFHVNEDQEGTKFLTVFSEVEFAYLRDGFPKTGRGWISEDSLTFTPAPSLYSEIIVEKVGVAANWIKEKAQEICPPAQVEKTQANTQSAKNNLNDLAVVAKEAEKKVNEANAGRKSVVDVAKALSSSVGKCALNPPNEAPVTFSKNLVYDEFVLPSLRKTRLPKNIRKQDGSAFTEKDLVDIDAMARAVYAEMASCADMGPQYQMAVARVLRNRQKAIEANPKAAEEFIALNAEHAASKSVLARTATSPVQISAWNQNVIDFDALKSARKGEVKALMAEGFSEEEASEKAREKLKPDAETKEFYKPNESGLLHSLCPPSNPTVPCYSGVIPDSIQNFAWESSLNVAVEMVLFPGQFEAKTAEMAGIKHYTSNRSRFYDYIEVFPTIDGHKVASKRCLNLWRPMTDQERKDKKEKEAAARAAKKPKPTRKK